MIKNIYFYACMTIYSIYHIKELFLRTYILMYGFGEERLQQKQGEIILSDEKFLLAQTVTFFHLPDFK